jgi:uncharacterized protein (DUF433 family)
MNQPTTKTLDQHIEITSNICGGKPRIAGHRITVQQIAIWHERLGKSADEIATEFELELADIHAALAYYFVHREEIDQAIAQSQSWIDEMRSKTPSLVKQKLARDSHNGGAD